MKKNTKETNTQEPHLTSPEPQVFAVQALIAAAVLFVVAYVVYLMVFGSQHVQVAQDATLGDVRNGDVNAASEQFEAGVDESMFIEGEAQGVDPEKLDGLFPQLNNN